MQRVIVSWSSGKDSTLSLLRLLDNPEVEVVALFTTYVNDSVPFQETPLTIIELQAERLGLPLITAELPEVFPENEVYQAIVVNALKQADINFDSIAFGDMFCNGIEDYRRGFLEPDGIQCLFPLLGEQPEDLAQEILDRKIETRVITVDSEQLNGKFVGQRYSREFIDSLPFGVDPCGENGEFHTLVTNIPQFSKRIDIELLKVDRSSRFHIQKYRAKSASSLF
jgi:uncharacterized protein (TIGR00290 family)